MMSTQIARAVHAVSKVFAPVLTSTGGSFGGEPPIAVANLPSVPAEPPRGPHGRVFELVRTGRYEDAARLAKRLIDADSIDGFFGPLTLKDEAASDWYEEQVDLSRQHKRSNWQAITPERARALLQANPDNRNINAKGLADRIRDMREGRWVENGEAIIVSRNGYLNDGQHRLWAAFLSSFTFNTTVAWGVERDTRVTVDIGEDRSGANRLSILGVKNSSSISAMTRLIGKARWDRELSKTELDALYFSDQERFQQAVRLVGSQPQGSPRAAFHTVAYFLLRSGHQTEKIKRFFDEIDGRCDLKKSGAPMTIRDAISRKQLSLPSLHLVYTVLAAFKIWKRGLTYRGIKPVTEAPDEVLS